MGKLIFDCGCEFNVDGTDDIIHVDNYGGNLPNGIDVDIYDIPLNCPRTWELISNGKTKCVFQLENSLGKTWSKKIKPNNLEELAAIVSLIRPGCLKAKSGDPPKSMTQRYTDRKNNTEQVVYLHDSTIPILEETYGIQCYQEQAMQIAHTLAGFNMQECDVLRKSIGKKKADIMQSLETKFIDGCVRGGMVTKEQAEEIFNWIRESQRYSFNKSHAVSYGKGSYWTAYLKAHFPAQFYCSYLHGARWKQDTQEEVKEIVNDAMMNGVSIYTPRFQDARDIPYIIGKDVYFGLGDIKQIGSSAIKKIKTAISVVESEISKEVKDWNWLDYLLLFSDNISSLVNEALITCGSVDNYNMNRTEMLYQLKLYNLLTKKEKEWIRNSYITNKYPDIQSALNDCARPKKEKGGCSSIKRIDIVKNIAILIKNPPYSMVDTADFISWSEEKYLGASITCGKIDSCKESIKSNVSCLEIANGYDGYAVMGVEITRIQEVKTKNGQNPGQDMAFLGVKDSTCAIDNVVIFPDKWKEYKDILYIGNTVLMRCDNKDSSLIVQKVVQI